MTFISVLFHLYEPTLVWVTLTSFTFVLVQYVSIATTIRALSYIYVFINECNTITTNIFILGRTILIASDVLNMGMSHILLSIITECVKQDYSYTTLLFVY